MTSISEISQLVRIFAFCDVVDVVVHAGSGIADEHQRVVQRTDTRGHRLFGVAERVEHIGHDRDIEPAADFGKKSLIASLEYHRFSRA